MTSPDCLIELLRHHLRGGRNERPGVNGVRRAEAVEWVDPRMQQGNRIRKNWRASFRSFARTRDCRGARSCARACAELSLNRQPEHVAQTASAQRRDEERATVANVLEPAEVEAALCQRGTDAAAQMRPPLGPVEARPAENPAAAARRGEIDAELLKECDATISHLAAVIGSQLTARDPPRSPLARIRHTIELHAGK
jgi:hypothetical protein